MKLTIFGATGTVGMQLVKQALIRGHTVRAFGRNVFTADLPEDEKLQLIQGALFDPGEVYKALKGSDAVLSAIGGGTGDTDKTRSMGMKNIIEQMHKAGVKRIVAIGGLGVLDSDDGTLLLDKDDYPTEYKAVGNEHRKAWEYLSASDLDWTFVCAPDIINQGPTGDFITSADRPPQPNHYKINAGDLAQFMLTEIEKGQYIRSRAGISAK